MPVITEQDLKSAILECQGQRNPDAKTCIKLAAYLIIHKELYGMAEPVYSYASEPSDRIDYNSGTEFSDAVRGKKYADVLPIIDELMEAVYAVNTRLYNAVIRKLIDIK